MSTTASTRTSVRRPRWTCRAAAIAIVTMASLVAVEVGTGSRPDSYVLALAGTLVLGALAFGGRLWRGPFGPSLAAVVLAVLTIAGQTLTATVGGPGSTDAHWSALGLAVVGCGLVALGLTLGLVAADAPDTAPQDEPEHPYAL